ncbi:GntR family transcriptional regulator [Bacillus atrophaeus]|uniref:GntR family transcriptional regulator n=1 Tax=Bacillus atrophaeus TaxID=1452 RepID=UPI000D02E492|nr:GntR family transcriptional regulator [Bacillus atrophaeus]PRS02056.1 phosphonate metabolism transcriptional regulator PhnF [Bacillus atrophaeus]
MHIDKQSPIPIYYQIMEQLKSQIKNGELQPDAPLPSEREYSEQFGISRMTVRQALSNLVNEGFLYRQKGRGTFVSRPKMEQTLQGLTSFTEDMKSRGMVPSSKLIDYELIDSTAELAGILDCEHPSKIHKVIRVRLANDIPMAIEASYIPFDMAGELHDSHFQTSIYEHIEQYNSSPISHAKQELEPSAATQEEAKLLEIKKGAPVLLIKRTTYLQSGIAFEHVKSIYRGDRYTFVHYMDRLK